MAKLADGSRASEYMKKTPWPREASMALLDGIRDLSVVETNAGTVGKEGPITTHCVANLNELYPHGVPVCPSCGASSKNSAQKKCRVLFDKPLHDRPHILYCYYDLFECKNAHCNKGTFAVKLDCAAPRTRITKHLSDYILDCSLYDDTLNAAARKSGISSTTAYEIRQAEVNRRLTQNIRYQATAHTGIDETFLTLRQGEEIYGKKSLFVTVMATRPGEPVAASLSDLIGSEAKAAEAQYNTGVVAFEKMATKADAVAALFRKMDDFDKVETMTMDMSRSFLAAVRDVNPKITIIIDRFHVVQSLNEKTKRTASAIYESLKADMISQIKDCEKADNTDPNRLRTLRKKVKSLEQHYRNDRFVKNSENLSAVDKAHFTELAIVAPALLSLYKLKEKMRVDFYNARTIGEAKSISAACQNEIPPQPKKKSNDLYKEMRTFFNTLENSDFSGPIYNYFLFPQENRFTNAALENFHKYLKLYINRTHGVSYDVLRYSVLFGKLNRKPTQLPITDDDLDNAINFCANFKLTKSSWRFIRRDAYNGYMLAMKNYFSPPEGYSFIKICNAILAADRYLYFYNYYSRFADVLPLLLQRIYELREQSKRKEIVCLDLKTEPEDLGHSEGKATYGPGFDWWYEVQKIHPLSDLIERDAHYCCLGIEDTALADAEESPIYKSPQLHHRKLHLWDEDD